MANGNVEMVYKKKLVMKENAIYKLIIAALLLGMGFLVYRMDKIKRNAEKTLKDQREKITDSLTDSFEAQKQLLISGQNLSKTTRTKSKKIDDKLKEDEKTIDNRDYDADAIDNLLSRFDKGSQ